MSSTLFKSWFSWSFSKLKNWVFMNFVSFFYVCVGLLVVLLFIYFFKKGLGDSGTSFSNVAKTGLFCFIKLMLLGLLLNSSLVKSILSKLGLTPFGFLIGLILGAVITASLFHGFVLGVGSLITVLTGWFFPLFDSPRMMGDSHLTQLEALLSSNNSFHEKMKNVLEQRTLQMSPQEPSPDRAPSLFDAEGSPIKSSSILVSGMGMAMLGLLAREGLKLLL